MSHLYLLKKETDGLKVRKSFTSAPSHQLLRCPQYSDYGRLKKQATNASNVHSYKIEKVYTISLNIKFLFYIGIQQTFSQGHNRVCGNFFFIIYVQPRICYN